MFDWSFRTWFIIIAAIALICWLSNLGYRIYNSGSEHAQLAQATAQIATTQKVQKKYAKIANSAPYGDRNVALKWLSEHTRPGN